MICESHCSDCINCIKVCGKSQWKYICVHYELRLIRNFQKANLNHPSISLYLLLILVLIRFEIFSQVHHPDVKVYFCGYDGSKYILQPWLRDIYPHDWSIQVSVHIMYIWTTYFLYKLEQIDTKIKTNAWWVFFFFLWWNKAFLRVFYVEGLNSLEVNNW